MRAIRATLFSTNLSTRMRSKIPILFRIFMFSTIAIVLRYWFIVLIITLRAFPVEDMNSFALLLLVYVHDPLLDAFQMHGNRTACASPNPVSSANVL